MSASMPTDAMQQRTIQNAFGMRIPRVVVFFAGQRKKKKRACICECARAPNRPRSSENNNDMCPCNKLCLCVCIQTHRWPLILFRVCLYLVCALRWSQDACHISSSCFHWKLKLRRQWQPAIALAARMYAVILVARSLSTLNRTIYYLFALPYVAHRTFPINCMQTGECCIRCPTGCMSLSMPYAVCAIERQSIAGCSRT